MRGEIVGCGESLVGLGLNNEYIRNVGGTLPQPVTHHLECEHHDQIVGQYFQLIIQYSYFSVQTHCPYVQYKTTYFHYSDIVTSIYVARIL